jgi:hypothetical protein
MGDALHIGETARRPNLAPEHPQKLELEGPNPPVRQDFQLQHASFEFNLTFMHSGGAALHSSWLMVCEMVTKAMT